MAVNDDARLGCGRTIDDLWDRMDLPPDAHEEVCPDCQAARADLAGLVRASRELLAVDRDDPTLHASGDVLGRVLDVARAEVRRGRTLPLREPDDAVAGASQTISEQTVASIVRRVADDDPDVEARRCQVVAVPGRHRPGEPSAMAVTLRLSVAVGASVPAVTRRLRDAVIDEVEATVGVELVTVDLEVEDVHDV